MDERLRDLRYSQNARYNSERTCLPNTRTAALNEIYRWLSKFHLPVEEKIPESVLLVHGLAGSGKSTIANTIAARLAELGRLGASFCFSRGDKIDRNSGNLFSTIARNLAYVDKAFKVKLFSAIDDPGLRRTGQSLDVKLLDGANLHCRRSLRTVQEIYLRAHELSRQRWNPRNCH
jgi:hypothetical protein